MVASGPSRSVCEPLPADTHIDESSYLASIMDPEQEDELGDKMTTRHMSIKER